MNFNGFYKSRSTLCFIMDEMCRRISLQWICIQLMEQVLRALSYSVSNFGFVFFFAGVIMWSTVQVWIFISKQDGLLLTSVMSLTISLLYQVLNAVIQISLTRNGLMKLVWLCSRGYYLVFNVLPVTQIVLLLSVMGHCEAQGKWTG